jgi:WD40 repeat protein
MPDGKRALSGGSDGVARLWTVDTAKEIRAFPALKPGEKPNPASVAAAARERAMLMQKSGAVTSPATATAVLCIAVSPGGKRFAAGSADRTLKLWEVETGKEIRQFTGHGNGVCSVAFSPDGKKILSGCEGPFQGDNAPNTTNRSIRLFDADTGKLIRTFDGHKGGIPGLAFSPDGNQFVSCGEDNTVRLWDVQTKKEIRRFQGHSAGVLCVTFSLDGRRILTGSRDRTLRMWNVATGQELRRFEGHRDAVTSVVLSRDGQLILSGSLDRTARLWRTTSSDKPMLTAKGGAPEIGKMKIAEAPGGAKQ